MFLHDHDIQLGLVSDCHLNREETKLEKGELKLML